MSFPDTNLDHRTVKKLSTVCRTVAVHLQSKNMILKLLEKNDNSQGY